MLLLPPEEIIALDFTAVHDNEVIVVDKAGVEVLFMRRSREREQVSTVVELCASAHVQTYFG